MLVNPGSMIHNPLNDPSLPRIHKIFKYMLSPNKCTCTLPKECDVSRERIDSRSDGCVDTCCTPRNSHEHVYAPISRLTVSHEMSLVLQPCPLNYQSRPHSVSSNPSSPCHTQVFFLLGDSQLHLERRHPVKGTSQTPHTYLSS